MSRTKGAWGREDEMKLLVSKAAQAAVLAAVALPGGALAQPMERSYGPGMMWDGGIFHMFFGFLMMLLFLAVIVALIVLAVRWLGGPGRHLFQEPRPAGRSALDILKERLAKGEIDVAEYEERKRALGE